MIRFCSLGSGSSGNASYIGSGAGGLLLDAGFSAKEIKTRLAAAEIDAGRIAGIVVSHEHSDHAKGAGVIARALNIPLFVNERTWERMRHGAGKVADVVHFSNGDGFAVGGVDVTPFSIPHDAVDPSAFVFSVGNTRLTFVTDAGYVTGLITGKATGADYLVVEANHDPEMLKAGPYPWELKQRIASRSGHLSNGACESLLAETIHPSLQGVTFAHLSETNNNPYVVEQFAKLVLERFKTPFHLARQHAPGPVTIVE